MSNATPIENAEEIPRWWVIKPIESKKSLADLVLIPTSFVRKIDWGKVHEVFKSEGRNPWPAYTLVGTGELARGAMEWLLVQSIYKSVPLYVEITKSMYEKLQ